MATLYVRNVPQELYGELQRWATESGRSVNAEVLALLEREAGERREREGWLERFMELRNELELTAEEADLLVEGILEERERARRFAGGG